MIGVSVASHNSSETGSASSRIGQGGPEGRHSRILGVGSHLPGEPVSNAELVERLRQRGIETSDEWIVARTGIRERHVAAEGETTSDLAYQAAIRAMEAELAVSTWISPISWPPASTSSSP